MRTEYEVLRDALIECYEQAIDGTWNDVGIDVDDDDIAEMAVTAVTALRDAFNECEDEITNDIE